MNKLPSATETALRGMQTNMRRLTAAAHEIATAPVERTEPTELTKPLVEMLEAQRAVEASAVVLRRTNEALDSVLDALS
jgi:flagellar basal body rod protein FlgG